MYIHWTHYYLPKVFAVVSFICNPFFIFLILTEQTNSIGKYRYIFLIFAVFNIIYSIVECSVPIVIHRSGGGFAAFISDGPFFQSKFSEDVLAVRSSCIGSSYGILVIHFIYRYLVLHKPHIIHGIFKPFGMLCVFTFFILHFVVWFAICKFCLVADLEIQKYIHEDIWETYQIESTEHSFLAAIYYDVSPWLVWRSIIGVILLTCFSTYAISTYLILGFKVMKELKKTKILSVKLANQHRQLFKALVIQTAIPVFVSFLPCFCTFLCPMIGLNFEIWNNRFGVVSLAAFPALDPLAIMLLLTAYRNRIVKGFESSFRNTKVTKVEVLNGSLNKREK